MPANDVDIAVVGSGFGGSLLAMVARRLGFRTILLERGRHPRFAIGESASPLAGVVLEQLADRYDLPRIRPLASFGEWRRSYPDVVCGLKRGFTYFKHETGKRYRAAPDRSNQLLVAASPHDEVADTHWLRADVDRFLVAEAVRLGVEYVDEVDLQAMTRAPSAWTLRGGRHGRAFSVRATLVVDASGPRGFVSRALAVDERAFDGYPAVQALYSHFAGVARCDAMDDYAAGEPPPYPLDDAALHHVFDDGWMWVLRFGNGVTSAGIAVTDAAARELRLADGATAWERLVARYPSVAEQLSGARPIREFTYMPRVPYRIAAAAGERWAMLPSAAATIDPLFSTGIPMTLLAIERLAGVLEAQGLGSGLDAALDAYGRDLLHDADHTARFVAGCYARFPAFGRFVDRSMFYFAAASFTESARRLGRPELAPGFLASRHPACAGDLLDAIDGLNVAGLADPRKRNWYGVDLDDVVRASHKFGLSPAETRARLAALLAPSSSRRTHAGR